jgi:hypothetical protein
MSRMYKRLQIDHPAIVVVNPAKYDERIFLLRTVDISAAGTMFRSEEHLSPDTPVKVLFLLKRGYSQQCRKLRVTFSGRVVRCEPGRFAVAFDEVHPIIMSPEEGTSQTVE